MSYFRKIYSSFSVDFVLSEGKQHYRLSGPASLVNKAHEDILKALAANSGGEVVYPEEWENQTSECELKQVAPGTAEWIKIERQVQETMPNTRIIKIERIQNKWLWEMYLQQRQRLAIKNGNNVNEQLLFNSLFLVFCFSYM